MANRFLTSLSLNKGDELCWRAKYKGQILTCLWRKLNTHDFTFLATRADGTVFTVYTRTIDNPLKILSDNGERLLKKFGSIRKGMRRVVVESPFAGDVETNTAYARRALRDCLLRGEAPIASHLLYTQPGVLDDNNPEERKLGIEAGLTWARAGAEASVVYEDWGISSGMRHGIDDAEKFGRPVEYRKIGHDE